MYTGLSYVGYFLSVLKKSFLLLNFFCFVPFGYLSATWCNPDLSFDLIELSCEMRNDYMHAVAKGGMM